MTLFSEDIMSARIQVNFVSLLCHHFVGILFRGVAWWLHQLQVNNPDTTSSTGRRDNWILPTVLVFQPLSPTTHWLFNSTMAGKMASYLAHQCQPQTEVESVSPETPGQVCVRDGCLNKSGFFSWGSGGNGWQGVYIQLQDIEKLIYKWINPKCLSLLSHKLVH